MGVEQGRPEPETGRGTFYVALRQRNDVIASNSVTGQNRYPSGCNW